MTQQQNSGSNGSIVPGVGLFPFPTISSNNLQEKIESTLLEKLKAIKDIISRLEAK